MRCAVFWPTPGNTRSASISCSSRGADTAACSVEPSVLDWKLRAIEHARCYTVHGTRQCGCQAGHQNGIFMPGGSCMPAVAEPIFDFDSASILFDASLKAA